jgi:hypothetical protein
MGRHLGARGWRSALSARIALVIGIVCITALAVAVPAMADDNSDSGSSDTSSSDSPSDDNPSDDDSPDAPEPATYETTPCTEAARACVDLAKQQAWLIDDQGTVTLGPVAISSGGPGKETPLGTFNVQWKDKNHKSQEFKLPNGQGAPMLWSVFFADGGIAFHGGSVTRASAGCVHLSDADAQMFYNTLQLGDEVEVH